MVTELVDYSFAWPGIPALKAAGKQGVFRYLTGTTTAAYGSKNLTPRESAELQAAGLSVTSNFESSAGFMLSSYDAGAKAAAAAARQHAWCGGPDQRPIYFSLDVNATYDQWKQAKAFLQGCASAIGWDRVGMYGGLFQLDWAAKELGMRWLWQSLGWSYGTTSPHALVKQYKNGVTLGNGTVDYDRAVVADWGQWNTTGGAMSAAGPEHWDTADVGRFRELLSSWLVGGTLADQGVNNVLDLPAAFVATQPLVQGIAQAVHGITVTLDLSQASPEQLDALASAIAGHLAVKGVSYAGTIDLQPKPA
jgi:Domain of unknown function (DUF1906)